MKIFKKEFEKIIDLAIKKFQTPPSNFSDKEIKNFIKKNLTCFSRIKFEKFGGIKVLPLFNPNLSKSRLMKKHPAFLNFIDQAGLLIGAVNFRRYVREGFDTRADVRYAVQGPRTFYFREKNDFINLQLFKRLTEKWSNSSLMSVKPHQAILGQAAIRLVNGFFTELTEENWKEFNSNPATQEIIQVSLFKIKEHLAQAELWANDYMKFGQEIELVLSEIATLLEIAASFKKNAVSDIFQEQLKEIPEGLKPYLKAGLGKTAMNVFAGINAAILQMNPQPIRIYSQNTYFEAASFIGLPNQFETILKDIQISKVNLYVGQFNPNIELEDKSYTLCST
jgi:hypothetical protein